MSKRLRECIPILEVYMKLKDKKKKKKYLHLFQNCIIKAVREMSVNLLRGNIDLTPGEKVKLKKYKMALRKLGDDHTSHKTHQKLVETQGQNLIDKLLPLVLSAINQ